MSWFLGKTLGIHRLILVAVAVAAVVGVYFWLQAAENADDKQNQEIGATVEREKNLTETIDRVEKADDVRETTTPGDRSFYDECLRTARTPANCERFLPSGQDDLGGAGAKPLNP
jgi:hypothetical protein